MNKNFAKRFLTILHFKCYLSFNKVPYNVYTKGQNTKERENAFTYCP